MIYSNWQLTTAYCSSGVRVIFKLEKWAGVMEKLFFLFFVWYSLNFWLRVKFLKEQQFLKIFIKRKDDWFLHTSSVARSSSIRLPSVDLIRHWHVSATEIQFNYHLLFRHLLSTENSDTFPPVQSSRDLNARMGMWECQHMLAPVHTSSLFRIDVLKTCMFFQIIVSNQENHINFIIGEPNTKMAKSLENKKNVSASFIRIIGVMISPSFYYKLYSN